MPPAGTRTAVGRNPVVLLLAVALFINYVDRGALPTAVHVIQADLGLTESQLGVLLSAFFWTYATVQIPVGWLAERYGAHRVLAIGLAIWGMATMLVGAASAFAFLLILRLLLGLGESAAFPSTSKLLAAAVAPERLGTANGIVALAYLLGPAVGTFAGGWLIVAYGWRASFLVLGLISIAWLLPWSAVNIQRYAPTDVTPAVPSTRLILRQRALWGCGLGHFSSNYTYYFMLSWLPFYLIRERGYSTSDMAQLAASAYLSNAVAALVGGWGVDRFIARGGSANVGYKLLMAANHLGAPLCMICIALGPRPLALGCIFIYQVLSGVSSPGVFAISQILAGPAAAGRWVGIQNTLGNLAGIAAPWLTGWMVQESGHFTGAFLLAALVSLVGFVGWVLIVPRLGELRWRSAGREPAIQPTRVA